MLHGFCTEHCWCSNPVVCAAGLRSIRGFLTPLAPLAFCASAGLSNPGITKLPAVKPVVARATATINFRTARIVSPVQIRASLAPAAIAVNHGERIRMLFAAVHESGVMRLPVQSGAGPFL